MANTKTYFTPNPKYQKITSKEVQVRLCDVTVDQQANEELTAEEHAQVFYSGCKEYDASFIWGQMTGWFKQTVDKPNASLAAERRGTLSYPDIYSLVIAQDQSILKQKQSSLKKVMKAPESESPDPSKAGKKKLKKTGGYPAGSRDEFFKKLLQNPSYMWPVGNNWSYKNKLKIYGSTQFESIKMADEVQSRDKFQYLRKIVAELQAIQSHPS